MAIICNVDLETAKSFDGKIIKTKYQGKKHQVYLRLVCDDFTIKEGVELAKSYDSILAITYQHLVGSTESENLDFSSVFVEQFFDLGNNITEEDLQLVLSEVRDGIIPVVRLPEDFKDLRLVSSFCAKYPTIRFCGGKLFALPNTKVGGVGVDILKLKGVKFPLDSYKLDGTDDALPAVDMSILDLEFSTKAIKAKKTSNKSSSSKKVTKKNNAISMQDLFASVDSSSGGLWGSF